MYLLFSVCGMYYGIAALILSCAASAFMFPAGMLYLLFFAPHAFLCFIMSKIRLKPVFKYALRYAVLLVFCNISLFVLHKAAMLVMFDMERILDTLGGYAVLTVVFSAVFIIYDLLFQNIRKAVSAMPVVKKHFLKDQKKPAKPIKPGKPDKPDADDIFKR